VDISVPPQQSDKQLVDYLSARGRPYLIVATKSDRLSGNQLHNAMRLLTKENPETRILPFSARTGAGKEKLWDEIRTAIESHPHPPAAEQF
jgi:GTP-binding protein